MFEDSLLESGGRNSKLHRRGPWATVFSFVIQAALVGVLVLIPLLYTEALPKQQLMGYLVAPPPPPPPPPPPAAAPVVKAVVKPRRRKSTTGSSRLPTEDSQENRHDQGRRRLRPASWRGRRCGWWRARRPDGRCGWRRSRLHRHRGSRRRAQGSAPPPPPQRVKVSAGVTAGTSHPQGSADLSAAGQAGPHLRVRWCFRRSSARMVRFRI